MSIFPRKKLSIERPRGHTTTIGTAKKNPRKVALRPELQCLAIMSRVWERPWLPTRIINRWLPHSFRASKHTGPIRNIYANPIYFCCYWFVISALGMEPRACHVTGKCPSTEWHSRVLSTFSVETVSLSCPCWPWTCSPLLAAPWVSEVTDLNHQTHF